jgi:hypothetical protein
MPDDAQEEIISFCLRSKYAAIRRKGYKKLKAHWYVGYIQFTEDLLKSNRDRECVQLVIDQFPPEHLERNFSTLKKRVEDSWQITKLYLRVAQNNLEKLDELSRRDEIAYAYVSVKLGRPLRDEEALAIFERNKYDDRLGLLIWCLGQMGLWSTLEYINSQIDILTDERMQLRLAKLRGYGPQGILDKSGE